MEQTEMGFWLRAASCNVRLKFISVPIIYRRGTLNKQPRKRRLS
ncbi:hypothetical protein QWZ13_15005 [Reinekea marina]|nr:hypothetical protein [Reinekea marina]MDN3650226.1 hypothetical protein [Reinekea marina]